MGRKSCYVTEKGSVSDLPQQFFLQNKAFLKELRELNTVNKLVNTDSELRHLPFNKLPSLHLLPFPCYFPAYYIILNESEK